MEIAWIVWVLTHTPQASASNGWIRADVLHGMPIGVCRFGYEKSDSPKVYGLSFLPYKLPFRGIPTHPILDRPIYIYWTEW